MTTTNFTIWVSRAKLVYFKFWTNVRFRLLYPLLPEDALQSVVPAAVPLRYVSSASISFTQKLTFVLDPESLTWDMLDEDLNRKLDSRSYVSLSHDRASNNGNDVRMGGEDQSENSGTAGEIDRSLFKVNMPGVLTRQQLEEQIDLDHWLLLVRGVIVHMEVFMLTFFHF